MDTDSIEWYSSTTSQTTPGHRRQKQERSMSFGGRLSSYQWQKGMEGRQAPKRLQPALDMMTRSMIGQMANPPNTAIAAPLQQAVSNLQGGDVGREFGVGGSMLQRLSGQGGPTAGETGGTPSGAGDTGGAGGGFAPGSFSPSAAGGQQGLQSRADLGLPDRSSYFTFMPSPQDIANIGLAPVRSSIKNKDQLNQRIDTLQQRQSAREAAGKDTTKVTKRLQNVQGRLAKNTGDLYWPKQ
jgi:hypothetical protein